jgi:O-antigen biosynthesis protein
LKISLFTPSHKADWLPGLYDSIIAQDHRDWEWVVLLNNGATFAPSDDRVKVYHETTGITNVGFLKRRTCELCTGDVLFEMDHDDLLLPGALSECAKAFEDESVSFAYSNTVNHDVRNDKPVTWSEAFGWSSRPFIHNGHTYAEAVSSPPYPQAISRIWFAPNHFRAWRRSFYWDIGGHNATMKISDDHDLMCRTYIHGRMVHIDKPLYLYRIHGENTWLKNADEIQTTMWACHDRYIEPMALRWANANGLAAIDLCGGIDKPAGYTSLDVHGGDITADLEKPWPLESDSVGVLRAFDAIEHMRDPIHTMNEAWRVLAHGGFMFIMVPTTDGPGAWCDPTHRSFWNLRSFDYYTRENRARYIRGAGFVGRFQKIKGVRIDRWDERIPYADVHLVAVKKDAPRFYGELAI